MSIIDRQTFDIVQVERKKRTKAECIHYSGAGIFASKLVCGECGSFFGRKIWHSNDKYRCIAYRCNNKNKEKNAILNLLKRKT